ncbi:uncharacterized protein DNG_05486 [Cephalotrichum gorgonifer]|uniref:Xylanolytic transcriptional activator regulatory domain-containing protein n=1 Tax=Cephalotrichum gorgonifer TaxID=2041049 RepID=A0AAE8MY02_9PEZI|nr:uncharacterized protein DNG_05486 [Cephalotrichum gorgonifer]
MAAEAPSPENGDSSQTSPPAIGLPDLASLVKENILANKDLLLRHIDAYFEYLYFTPCLGFIHRKTIYREFEEGRLHASRAAGICSVSAFFVSSGAEAVAFAAKCSMQVEFHIFRTIGSLKETNLYLYAFDILHNHMSGRYAKCWQLMAVACRLMIGLQLNWEVPGSTRPFKEQECARRLAWQIFHFDRLIAGGFDAYVCCREDNMKIRLPCPEDAFNADKEVFVERLQDRPAKGRSPPGLHGWQVRLLNTRHHVLIMSKQFASGPAYLQRARWEPSKVMGDIGKLQSELSRFGSSLPAYLKLSDQNISRWVHSPERQGFVLLHGLYCTTHIDLYRFSLPGIRERGTPDLLKKLPRDFILKSQKQAVAHAITLARFWETVYNEAWRGSNGRAILLGDYNIAQCVQQCIKVLITAKQHKLYQEDLSSHSTAPLWRNEPVDEGSIRPLIDSCLRILEPWSRVIPSVKPQFDEAINMVNEFDRTSIYEEEKTYVELIAGDGTHPIRLPGAHQLLENVYLAQKVEEDAPMPPAAAVRFFSAAMNAAYSHDPYTGLDAPDNDWQSDSPPPKEPSPSSATMGAPAGPEGSTPAPAPAPMQGGYPHRAETLPARQGSGLPIMTVRQLTPAHYMDSHSSGGHQQARYSDRQNEPPHRNFAAPDYDTALVGGDVLAHQPQGYPQG